MSYPNAEGPMSRDARALSAGIGSYGAIQKGSRQPNANSQAITSRCEWIDVLRLAAAVGVIYLHVAREVLRYERTDIGTSWQVANAFNALTRWAVPVFVMVSGMLLIPRAARETPRDFYRRRLLRLAIPTAAWTAFYITWVFARIGRFDLVGAVAMAIYGNSYYHIWFLYMLFGLYLVTPCLTKITANGDRRWLASFTILGLLVTSCLMIVAPAGGAKWPGMMVWPFYLPLFLLGHVLADSHRFRLSLVTLAFTAIVPLMITGLAAGLLQIDYGGWQYGIIYNRLNPLVVIAAVAIFLLFRDRRVGLPGTYRSALVFSSQFTLGIYVVHPFIIDVLRSCHITPMIMPAILGIPLCATVVCGLSLLTCMGIAALPWGRRLVV